MRDAMIITPMANVAIVPPMVGGFRRIFASVAPFYTAREVNINASRAMLQNVVRNMPHRPEWVILMDSDVHVTPGALDALFEAWKEDSTPCIQTKEHRDGHVVTACALMKTSDYLKVDYMAEPYSCQCTKLPNPFYIENFKGKEI